MQENNKISPFSHNKERGLVSLGEITTKTPSENGSGGIRTHDQCLSEFPCGNSNIIGYTFATH